jgi:hypothetical protein
MSPLELYGCAALICVAAAVVGWGVLAAAGWRRWSWLAPALGLAVLSILGGTTIYLPGEGIATTIALVAAVAAGTVLWIRRPPGDVPMARSALVVAVLVVLAAWLPFAAGGGFEILGTYVNNDLAFHIYDVEWVRSGAGIEPDHIADGYPLGPHGIVLATSAVTTAGLPAAWTGYLIAVAVLTALASLTLLSGLSPVARTIAALLVGMSYLGASFYVQSAFKETTMALVALGFALALREAVGEGTPQTRPAARLAARAVPPAAFAAASLVVYSGPGLAWPGGTLALWAAVAAWSNRESLRTTLSRRRWLVPSVAVGLFLGATAAALVAWERAADLIGGKDLTGETAVANLFSAIPPYEVLGIGLSNDYRIFAPNDAFASILALLGAVAVGLGVLRLARRRELVLLAALGAAAIAYLVGRYSIGPYAGSKGLAVAAPLVMLTAFVGLAPGPDDRDPWARRGRAALLLAFTALALFSSYLALAGARLDHDDHFEQLAELRPQVEGERVLFLGSDEYAAFALRGASVVSPEATTLGLYVPQDRPAAPRTGERLDFDSVSSAILDSVDYVVTTRSRFASEPPPQFRRVDSTDSFELWQRTGPVTPTQTLREGELPGNFLDCGTEEGREISRLPGFAEVVKAAVIVPFGTPVAADTPGAPMWLKEDADGAIGELPAEASDDRLTRELQLPAGRWELSIQYHSLEPLVVDAPGLLRTELPPNSARLGPYWPLGTVDLDHGVKVPVTVNVVERPFLRRLLGGPPPFRLGPEALVGIMAAVPAGRNRERVPLSEACGRLVDWYVIDEGEK